MLKGHTKIELTDVNTGKVDVYENDNMFTQAIYSALNNTWTQMVGGLSTLKNWHLPICTKMLGGVVLFADTIEESEQQTYFPEDNEVLGYAGTIASDGSNKFWGGRNTLESEAYDPETKTVKWVWDFGTSQGNGTIKAVGLMDGRQADYYGRSAWNKEYSNRLDVSSYFSPFGYQVVEWDGDDITYMTNGTGQVEITKSRFNLSKITLNNVLASADQVSKHTVALPLESVNYYHTFWKDGDDGYWYGFINMRDSNFNAVYNTTYEMRYDYYGSAYLQIIRINKQTFSMEYHNVIIPNYYVHATTCNPIITSNYIITPISTSTSFYSRSTSDCPACNVRKDRLAFISKFDWTCSIRDIVDENNNPYFMFPNTYAANPAYYTGMLFGGQFQNLKLPNGTYQMNDLILDDDGYVIEQLKGPMNSTTNTPETNPASTYSMYTLLNPFVLYQSTYDSGYAYRKPRCLILNKKKNLILCVLYSGGFQAYIIPMTCQELMTINNLLEPVTKTSTQSMKITYSVTDADDE